MTAYPMVEGHDTEQRKSLTCSPDSLPVTVGEAKGGHLRGRATGITSGSSPAASSSPHGFWLETTRVVAMRSEARAFYPTYVVAHQDVEDVAVREGAGRLAEQSSVGLLDLDEPNGPVLRGAGWAQKKADLKKLPVLDLRRLAPAQLQGLSDLFDRLAEAEFERLPRMADCPARRALDDGVSEILGLPDLATLREPAGLGARGVGPAAVALRVRSA